MSPIFAGEDRDSLRRAYLDAWRKSRSGGLLTPLETQIAAAIADHPEYHDWLERGEAALGAEFGPDAGTLNPFLHLGLHLALRDQIATDRPSGIARIAQRLTRRLVDPHAAEHSMLEILGELLWEAQRAGRSPDEARYLERLARL